MDRLFIEHSDRVYPGSSYVNWRGFSVRCICDNDSIPINNITSIIQQEQGDSLLIYPNPSTDKININFQNTHNAEYFIFNLSGALLDQNIIYKNTIDISSLPKGIYVVKITTDSQSLIEKFIKQ